MTKEQDFSDPKQIINLNSVTNIEIKKDLKFELTESKKGVFNSNKKHVFKAITLEDLEIWDCLIRTILATNQE